MSSKFLLVDNGVLQTLWEVGGIDALEHLFDRGLQVVIPRDVIEEIDVYPGYKDVQSWVENNDRIIKPNYVDPIADAARSLALCAPEVPRVAAMPGLKPLTSV